LSNYLEFHIPFFPILFGYTDTSYWWSLFENIINGVDLIKCTGLYLRQKLPCA
jgi:hypothetical protein